MRGDLRAHDASPENRDFADVKIIVLYFSPIPIPSFREGGESSQTKTPLSEPNLHVASYAGIIQ